MTDLLDQYKHLRKELVNLHSAVLKKCTNNDVTQSAKVMGILRNNTMVLNSENEKDSHMDFLVYGAGKSGKSILERYMETHDPANEDEKALLEAMKKSTISLYEVAETNRNEKFIMLKDVFDSGATFKVIDTGMSASLKEETLVFTRLIHLEKFSMTSGLGFVFSPSHKEYLLKRSRKLIRKINSGNPETDRFIAFFTLNRSDGLAMMYGEIASSSS